MTTDNAIRIFSEFLNSSWTIVNQLLIDRNYTSNEDSLNDWLQSNWEFLVERKILKLNDNLEVYGDGADLMELLVELLIPILLPILKYRLSLKIINLCMMS